MAATEHDLDAEGDVPAALKQQVAELFFAVLERVKRTLAETAAAFDLTPQQTFLLHILDRPRRMGELAEALNCDPSNVTGLVDRAERRNLLRRDSDPYDRRSRRLVLTDEGRAVRAAFEQRLVAELPLTAGLSADQLEQLRDLLATVVRSMNAPPCGGPPD